jgi:hypothetical protein
MDCPVPQIGVVYHDFAAGLFSTMPLFYGASMMAYSMLVFGVGLITVLVLVATRLQRDRSFSLLLAVGVFLVFNHLIFFYGLGSLLTERAMGMRYSAPISIALIPVIVGLSLSRLLHSKAFSRTAAICFFAVLAFFCESFVQQINQLVQRHTRLAFDSKHNDFASPTSMVLSGYIQDRLRRAQYVIPNGVAFLAIVDSPFQFNFMRNPIYDIEPAGAANAWGRIPAVQYILWDRNSSALSEREWAARRLTGGVYDQRIAARWLDYLRCIDRIVQSGVVVYDQAGIVVYNCEMDITEFY